jgi:hypothetical protein
LSRNCGDQRAGGAAVENVAAPQLLEDRVDRKRVAADQLGAQRVDDRDRLHAAVDALAQAGDTLVGLDPHPQMHAVALGRGGFDSRDFHMLTSHPREPSVVIH